MSLRTVTEVAADLQVSEWTIHELVRNRRVDYIRINTGASGNGPIRFTTAQVDALLDVLTVRAAQDETSPRLRRRRRSA